MPPGITSLPASPTVDDDRFDFASAPFEDVARLYHSLKGTAYAVSPGIPPVTISVRGRDRFFSSFESFVSAIDSSVVSGVVLYAPRASSVVGRTTYTYSVKHRPVSEIADALKSACPLSLQGADFLAFTASADLAAACISWVAMLDSPRPQYTLHAAVVEVTDSDSESSGLSIVGRVFGVSFSVSNALSGVSASITRDAWNLALQQLRTSSVASVRQQFTAQLSSSPVRIVAGQDVPILQAAVPVSSSGGNAVVSGAVAQTVSYRPTGYTCDIVPSLVTLDLVRLKVQQTLSSVAVNTTSRIDSPLISRREFTTDVDLRPGRFVVLGGLNSSSSVDSSTRFFGVPIGSSRVQPRSELLLVLAVFRQ